MRALLLKDGAKIRSCPNCGNRKQFNAHSQQISEDCCEVWIECQCGFDPTAERTGHRLESVMGGTGNENVYAAIQIWNDLLTPAALDQTLSGLVEIRDSFRSLFSARMYRPRVDRWRKVIRREMERNGCDATEAMLSLCNILDDAQDRLWCIAACIESLECLTPEPVSS